MLTVEHFVAPSEVHGLGVFSKHFIPQGALVWQAHPILDREITRAELDGLPDHVVRKIMTHAEYLPNRDIFRLAADGDYFMNHADEPNIADAGDTMYAARDIAPGEELLCDYRAVRVVAFDPDAQSAIHQIAAVGGA